MSRFTIVHVDDLERPWPKWALARKGLALTAFGMNVAELPPGESIPEHDEVGRDQEEVFVVLDGTLTIDLGDPPERHEVARGGVVVVERGTILQLRNAGAEEVVLYIYGAPPETGKSEYFEDAP